MARENEGANFRVAAEARRILHHLFTDTDREKIDMKSSVYTMNFANNPIELYSSIKLRFTVSSLQMNAGAGYHPRS